MSGEQLVVVPVKKLDAAREQLQTAIRLWFSDVDTISTHTLACAAHQIIHDINTKRKGRDLLLDTLVIKDEYRNNWIKLVKRDMNFFKHADKDPDGSIEFHPQLTFLFILMSVLGLEVLGEKLTPKESVFTYWNYFHKPQWLTENGRQLMAKFTAQQLDELRTISKPMFYEAFFEATANNGKSA